VSPRVLRLVRSLAAVAAVVVAVVALTGGVAWLGHRAADTGPGVPEPSRGHDFDLKLTYVGVTPAGPRLFSETHTVPDARQSQLTVAVTALMTDSPTDDDYRNYLLASHTRAHATQRDGTITIDFAKPLVRGPDMSDATADMVLQAIAHTADDAVGSDVPVRFSVAGHRVSSLLGIDASRPVVPVRDASVESAVSIAAPGEDTFAKAAPIVRGRASSEDGRVYWEVFRKDGLVKVAHGRSAPGRCCEFTPFVFPLPTLPRGSPYLLVVGDHEALGDGGTTVDTKEFSVR
jgi:hypothetical protein